MLMTDKELIEWLKDKIIYFSNEEAKTEDDYWKGKSRGTREAYELILGMLELRNYNSAGVNADGLPLKLTISNSYGVIGEYVVPTGMRDDTVNLCDNCKFINECNPTLTGHVEARTTQCSKYKRTEKEADNDKVD